MARRTGPGVTAQDTTTSDDGLPAKTGRRRAAGWSYGVPALTLLVVASGLHLVPVIEQDIRRGTIRLAAKAGDGALGRYRARAEVEGRDVTVVADLGLADDVRNATEAAIRSIPGVRSVRTDVALPLAMSPFTITIRRSAAGISLVGGVTSAEDRAALVEQAGTLVPAENVVDRLRLATGAPPDAGLAARFLLTALARTGGGDAVLSDRSLRVRAVAPDTESYEATRAALRRPPAGFTLEPVELEPPLVQPFTWTVVRGDNGLRFEGFVPAETARASLLEHAAAALPGIRVDDAMRTARGIPAEVDYGALTGAVVSALAELEAGRAELAGSSFRFSGEGVDKAQFAAIEGRIRGALPSGIEAGPITLTAIAARPFRVLARRSGGRVVLTGFVPGERERRDVAALVAARYPGEKLTDRRIVADGAPAGFPEAQRAALEGLAEFADGEATIRDTDLRLTGRILYGQVAARLREAFPKTAPAGWSATIAIEPVAPERALDAMACGDVLADAGRRDPLRFESGKAEIAPQSRAALDNLADIARRCGGARITVAHDLPGPADRTAETQKLATARAEALIGVLTARGATARFVAEGRVRPAGSAGPAGERTDYVVSP